MARAHVVGDHCSLCEKEFTRLSGNRLGCVTHGVAVRSREDVRASRVHGIRHHCNELETKVMPFLEFQLSIGLQAIIGIARGEAARLARED